MKDQNPIESGETKRDKWNRALDLFIESVLKPDDSLRLCAHNQKCHNEFMDLRNEVLADLRAKRWH